MCIYIYIYIYREREIYIYIHYCDYSRYIQLPGSQAPVHVYTGTPGIAAEAEAAPPSGSAPGPPTKSFPAKGP